MDCNMGNCIYITIFYINPMFIHSAIFIMKFRNYRLEPLYHNLALKEKHDLWLSVEFMIKLNAYEYFRAQ
jgi:hypothetical protein